VIVQIDGVQYVPVAEVPAAADLMRRIAELWWGDDDQHARDPAEYRELRVIVTDSGEETDPTIEEFTAFLLRKSGTS
jgi:hypothetical protein